MLFVGGLLALFGATFFQVVPPDVAISASFKTTNPYIGGNVLAPSFTTGAGPKLHLSIEFEAEGLTTWSKGPGPFVISPSRGPRGSAWTSSSKLSSWVEDNKDYLDAKLLIHGALLFRGFPVKTVQDFEALSLVLVPELEKEYLGTSPRRKFNGSKYVHTASEFPGWRVIPSHCEMSFKHNPPKKILFFAQAPNKGSGGETPIVDFRAVWQEMNAATRARFLDKKLKYVRQYYDEDEGTWDALKTKSWQAMFETRDANVVEEKCFEAGFHVTWMGGTRGKGTVKLVHTMPPTRHHPETGDEIWFNHLNVLYVAATEAEYAFSAQHLSSWKYVALHYGTRWVRWCRKLMYGADDVGQHTLHADGSEIASEDIEHVRTLVWNNTFLYSHAPGDVVLLDNYRLGHGRQPYSGERTILTTWG